ncbi:hypothetical protein HKD37_07G018582 [Glycine soja]
MGPTYSDMGCKLALEDKERVAFRRRQRHEHVDATRHAKTCNFSSLASQQQGHITKEKLIEFLCSSCLLCVCCPLACVCCFIKLPCRICHQALRCAWKWACYGSKNNRVRADYSSFSDIDSNATSGKVKKPSRVFLKTEEDTDFINCYVSRWFVSNTSIATNTNNTATQENSSNVNRPIRTKNKPAYLADYA